MKFLARSLPVVVALSLVACTSEEPTSPPSGTDATAPQAEAPKVEAPVVAAGPVGTWKLDGAATFTANEATMKASMGEAPAEEQAMMVAMMTEMFNAMNATLTFAADNTIQGVMSMPNPFTGDPTESKMAGTWSVDGTTVTMTTRQEGGTADEVQSGTLQGDTLEVTNEQGGQTMVLVFKRQS
jgi:hypothetical protein